MSKYTANNYYFKDVRQTSRRMMQMRKVYWTGDLGPKDDFGSAYGKVMYDGRTKQGPWANMSEASWRFYGIGRLGTGYGQKYERQADGRWLKVEG